MTSPTLAMLAVVAVQAAMGTLTLSDAARIYARRSLVDDSAFANLENSPRIAAELRWPTVELGLGYEPRLTFVDVFGSGPSPALWLHNGGARLALREPNYTFTLSQTASVGEQDFSQSGAFSVSQPSAQGAPTTATQASGPASAPQPMPGGASTLPVALLPNARDVRVADEQTAASLTYQWSRRWRSDVKASFGFSGGSTVAAQTFLPRQRRAQLDAALGFDWSRRDQLSSVFSGAQIGTSNGYEHWLATVSEAWSTRWSANSASMFAAGAAFQDTTAPGGRRTDRWSPIGSANVSRTLLQHDVQVRLQAGVAYAPELNVLIGRLQNRLQASSQASLAAARYTISLGVAAAQTLPTTAPDAATVANATLAFDYELVEWLAFETGGQLIRQSIGGASASARTTWLLYAGLTAQAPEIRF